MAEKVVKSIEKSRIDELEEELSRLKKVFRDHFLRVIKSLAQSFW